METIGQWILMNRHLDPRLMTVRIDEIITSKDLSLAKVYLYHADDPASLAHKLNKKHHPLHQHIFQNLKIRRVPKIKFLPIKADVSAVLQALDDIDGL